MFLLSLIWEEEEASQTKISEMIDSFLYNQISTKFHPEQLVYHFTIFPYSVLSPILNLLLCLPKVSPRPQGGTEEFHWSSWPRTCTQRQPMLLLTEVMTALTFLTRISNRKSPPRDGCLHQTEDMFCWAQPICCHTRGSIQNITIFGDYGNSN